EEYVEYANRSGTKKPVSASFARSAAESWNGASTIGMYSAASSCHKDATAKARAPDAARIASSADRTLVSATRSSRDSRSEHFDQPHVVTFRPADEVDRGEAGRGGFDRQARALVIRVGSNERDAEDAVLARRPAANVLVVHDERRVAADRERDEVRRRRHDRRRGVKLEREEERGDHAVSRAASVPP